MSAHTPTSASRLEMSAVMSLPGTNAGEAAVPEFTMYRGDRLVLPSSMSMSPSASRSAKRGCEKVKLGTPLGLNTASSCSHGWAKAREERRANRMNRAWRCMAGLLECLFFLFWDRVEKCQFLCARI